MTLKEQQNSSSLSLDDRKLRLDALKEHYKANRDDLRSLRVALFSFLPLLSAIFAFFGGASLVQQAKNFSQDLTIAAFFILLLSMVMAMKIMYWLISRIIKTEMSILMISCEMDKITGIRFTDKGISTGLSRRASNFAIVALIGCLLAGLPATLLESSPAMTTRHFGISLSTILTVIGVMSVVAVTWSGLFDIMSSLEKMDSKGQKEE